MLWYNHINLISSHILHHIHYPAMNIRNATYTDISFICFLLAFTHFNRIHAFSFAVNIGPHFHVAIILAL